MQQAPRDTTPQEIIFSNGNCARVETVLAGSSAVATLEALSLETPRPVILVAGGAGKLDERTEPRLAQLFSRAVARVAAERGAAIVDGGTQAGIMALMGQGVADRGRSSVLLGVAPLGKVTYPGGPTDGSIPDGAPLEPNHTHFVLVQQDNWGQEGDTLDALAQAMAGEEPAVTILADGGPIAVDEVLRSVRRRWPIIVLAGTGRLADQIATHLQKKTTPEPVDDRRLDEILADGRLQVFSPAASVADLARMLNRCLHKPDPALAAAWRQFAWLDANASAERTSFERLQKWILALGVLATFLALVQTQLGTVSVSSMLPSWLAPLDGGPLSEWLVLALRYALVLVTITTTVLLGALARFKGGTRWVILRGSAEAIKREIFRYRVGATPYTEPPPARSLSRGQELVDRVNTIGAQAFATELSELALRPYRGQIPPPMYGAAADDTGFGVLPPDRYVDIRIGDQVRYYQGRANRLDWQLRLAQWATLILGGLATLLAAMGGQLWVPFATVLSTAVVTYLEYQQTGPTLAKYNQSAANLLNIQAWWDALPALDRASPSNLAKLVGSTEEILEAELTGWVRQMHDALEKLRTEPQREPPQTNAHAVGELPVSQKSARPLEAR